LLIELDCALLGPTTGRICQNGIEARNAHDEAAAKSESLLDDEPMNVCGPPVPGGSHWPGSTKLPGREDGPDDGSDIVLPAASWRAERASIGQSGSVRTMRTRRIQRDCRARWISTTILWAGASANSPTIVAAKEVVRKPFEAVNCAQSV